MSVINESIIMHNYFAIFVIFLSLDREVPASYVHAYNFKFLNCRVKQSDWTGVIQKQEVRPDMTQRS